MTAQRVERRWVKASIFNYIAVNWSATQIDWPKAPLSEDWTEWIHPMMMPVRGRHRKSEVFKDIEVQVDIFNFVTSDTYRADELIDLVKTMLENADITVYGYDDSSSLIVGGVRLYEGEEIEMPAPGGAELCRQVVTFPGKLYDV